ncbi:conserved hypothetical protein, partial [Trichinella spiralis]|jgi:hypothetical protein
MSIQ